MISFVPFIMLFLFYGSMGMAWWLVGGEGQYNEYAQFMQGHMNNGFVAICSLICFVALMIFIWTSMIVVPHADDIDDLEKAKEDYREAIKELKNTKKNYIDLIEKEMAEKGIKKM